MKIYLAGLITGQTGGDVFMYFENTAELLASFGYKVLYPLMGKDYLRTETEYKSHGYEFPASTDHAIFERDKWMVSQSDIVYCNLVGAKTPSIGCSMELAWASLLGKHTVLSMEDGNPSAHAFIFEAADVVFKNHVLAIDYLETLIPG